MLTPSAESAAGAGTGDGETEGATQGSDDGSTDANAAGAAQSAVAMGGVRRQLSPPFLNMQRLRSSELPAVSMHSSARALAAFYNGITCARLLPADLVAALPHIGAQQQLDPRSTHEDGGAVAVRRIRWAAGFQLGEARDGSRSVAVLGHGAVGGTVGFCVPQCGLAVAVTVSKLSAGRGAAARMVDAVLADFGLRLTHSAGLVQADDAG